MTLSETFGPIRQIAYVVPEIDAAIETWNQQLGVGPFAVAHEVQPLLGARYRGQPAEPVTLNLGFGYIGDVQLELIEQVNAVPSMYREVVDRGGFGQHHYAHCVEDFDAAFDHVMANGFEAVVETGAKGYARMSYVESQRVPGLVLELIEWNDLTRPYFDGIQKLVDTADPGRLVREFELSELASGGSR